MTRLALSLAFALTLLGCDDGDGTTDAGDGTTDAGTGDAGDATTDAGDGTTDAGPGTDAGAPVGSAGCGDASPASGALTIDFGGESGDFIVSLPSDYDPNRPYPLGFGFHGANRTHENCQQGDCRGFQDAMGEQAILVYMRSVDRGWPYPTEVRERNVTFFEAVFDRMVGEYCVDEARVFAAGTSSGATFANVLACRYGDRLLAVAPVAGGIPETSGCVGQVAALVVHGVDDYHVPFTAGEEARDHFLDANGCTHMASPVVSELHDRVVANRETHECADYMGCPAGLSVRWCEHSEGGYDGSTHGWPTFGGDAIWEFVQSL